MKNILNTAVIGALTLSAMAFAPAAANTITIAGGLGTIDCSTSCEAFTLGAPALGGEPNAAGTLSGSDAWYYDGTPSSENAEADRLSILISGSTGVFSGSDGSRTTGSGGDQVFATLAEWVVLKVGNVTVFVQNTGLGSLTIDYDSFAGAGSGLSHFTEFGTNEVPIPGAIWLMGAGLAGLGFSSRKKKAA